MNAFYFLRTTVILLLFLAVSSANAQPVNDNPCSAVALPVVGGQCNWTPGSNIGATATTGVPRPTCGDYKGKDVWYVAMVPSTGSIIIDTKQGTLTDIAMTAYSAATCSGPFTQLACDLDGSTNLFMPKITLNNLTPGSYVFIRVYDHVCNVALVCSPTNPHQEGTFEICATVGYGNVTGGNGNVGSYNCNTTPRAGNTCETATPICTFDGYCGSTSGYTANYWSNGNGRGLGGFWNSDGIFCGSIENNSFMSFIAGASSVQLEVEVTGSSSACDEGVQFMMFGNPTGAPACQSLDIISYGCESPMPPGSNNFTGSGLTVGQQYYLMVDGFAGDICNYQINAISGVLIGLTAGKDRTICLGESVSLSVYGAGAGAVNWTGPYLNSSTGQTVTATPTALGTFQYIVSAPSLNPACSGPIGRDTVLVTVVPTLNSIGVSQSGGGCAGGAVTLTATGGTRYEWYPPDGLSATTGASVTASPTVTTTYTVIGTNAGGCFATNTITVTPSGGPTLTATTPNDTICTGGSGTTLNASAGFTSYSWTPTTGLSPTTGATVTANPSTPGTYSYVVTATLAGCPNARDTVVITALAAPNANAGTDKILSCAASSVALSGSSSTPGVTFSWAGPGIVSGGNTATPTVNATGLYTLTVSNGCTATDQVNVTSSATPPNANAGTDKVLNCSSSTVALSGSSSTAGATFSWAGPGIVSGGNTAAPTVNAAGTYTLTVTDPSNGCTATDQVNVTSSATPPNANAGTDKVLDCSASTVSLSGSSSTAGATFSWAGPGIVSGGNTATPTVNAAGTYTLTVTDPSNGCTATDQVNVTSSATPPNANAGTDKVLDCAAATVALSGSSSTAGATFSWAGPGIVSGGNTATPTVNAAGTYTLTVTDPSNGCTATDQVNVTSSATPPNANAGTDKVLNCAAATVSLSGSSSTAGATFSWAGPGIVSGGNTATPTVNAAGTYTLTVTDPSNGCTATDQVNVTGNSTAPNANAGTDKVLNCAAATVSLSGSSSTAGATFSWAGPGIVSGGNTATPTVNSAGTYTLTVTDPSNGCTATDQVNVTSSATPPNANAGADKVLDCAASTVSLSGSSSTAGATFSWAGPGIVGGGNTATPTVNAAGTYTLTVTDPSNGCTATDQVNVTSSATPPNANAGTDKVLNCAAATVSLSGSSSTAGATFSWAGPGIVSGGNTATPSVNAAGTYTLTVTDPSNGCTAIDQVNVTSSATPPNANAGTDKVLDCAAATVSLSGSSSTSGATFSWSGPGIVSGGNTATPTVNAAGTYTLTVTDPSNGCTATDLVNVTSSATPPNANAGTDKVLDCAAATVSLSGSSSTAGATFSWAGPGIVSGGNTATPTVNAAGTYTLTVTDPSNGCTATDQVNVTSSATPPNANAGTDKVLNCAASTVSLSGSSSTAGATFSWAGPGIVSGGNTATPTVNAAGTYTLTVTDPSNGCTATDQVNVTGNSTAPNANAGTDKVLSCAAATVSLSGSSSTAGATFSWAGPGIVSGGNTATPTVNVAGTYTLTVTDPSNGCTATDQVNVTGNSTAPNANAGTDKVLNCAAATVSLSGSSSTAGATFSWAGPGIVSGGNTATPTVNAAGTYTLTVTDPSNGCTATDQVNVTSSATPPNANAGTDKVLDCAAATVALSGSSSTAGATFSWAGPGIVSGGNTATPTVNAAGTYTLTVTDPSNGCTATDQVNVTGNSTAPNANAGTDKVLDCSALTVALSGSSSTAGATFSWAGPGIVSGGNTATPTVNAAGTYTLTVTDPSNGCTATDQVNVTGNSTAPNANAGADKVLDCATATVSLSGSSSTAGATFSWAGPGIVSGGNTATPTVNAAGTYTLTVTDPSNGCTATDQVNVTGNSTAPNANAGTDKVLDCAAATVSLSGSSSTAGATFSWAGPGIVSGGNTATPTVNAAGLYTLTVTDPSNGCTATDQVDVTANIISPNADAGSDVVLTCTLTSVSFNGSSSTTGAAFSWTGPGIVSGGNTATPTVNAAGTYTLTITDPSNGCTATDQVDVSGNTTAPDVDAAPNRFIPCGSTDVQLTGTSATAGATFVWTGPGIVSGDSTPTVTVNATGIYTLTVTDPANGCTASEQVEVTGGKLALEVVIRDNPCPDVNLGKIDLTVSGGGSPYICVWSTGDTIEDLDSVPVGMYTVKISDITGCTIDTGFTLNAGIFDVTALRDSRIPYGESVQLNAFLTGGTGDETYEWEPMNYLDCSLCKDPVATPELNTTYLLTAIDTNGCKDIDSVTIIVDYDLYTPNAFSPNADGVNDNFAVLGRTESIVSFDMKVFNRWNEMVFNTNDINRSWDGTYLGELQDPDVFIYAFDVVFLNGTKRTYKGTLALLR